MSRKKILFVINIDWFFISHRLDLALEAIKKGFEVHIACGISDKKEYLESLGLVVHPLEISRSGTGIFKELKAFLEIYRVLRKIKPDIAHFITIKPILYGGIISRFLDIKVKLFAISGLGYIFIKRGIFGKIARFFIKFLYKTALGGKNSYVIVQNSSDKQMILDLKAVNRARVLSVKGSGVNLELYSFSKEQNYPIGVVMVSRLLKDKGVWEFVEASKILKQEGVEVKFKLYGTIDMENPASLIKSDLEKIADEGSVEVCGFAKDVNGVFSQANIVVLPSYREGMPKVLLEAAACGRAVITTDVPGCKDAILPNITGLLCKAKDEKSLAKQIKILVDDEELRQKMGRAGRELALNEFDIKKVIEKHFDIYEGRV